MATKDLIQKIEEYRGSKVITYLTSDRQGPINAKIAMDVIPVISSQLRNIRKTERIDLFLYSTGGDTMVPWRLVSMIREYCDIFSVLVPYRAHSAATMIALGADEIVMSDLSELSPIDPSTANVFNPQDSKNPQNRIPISVEDVMAYFDLAKNKFGIKSDEEEEEINKIVDSLTEKLYSHQYLIGRKEAKDDLGIKTIQFADKKLADLMTELYETRLSIKKSTKLPILKANSQQIILN